MSIDRYHRLAHVYNSLCDRCGAMDRAGRSVEEAERIATEDGWRTIQPDGTSVDLCPLCRARAAEGQK